MSDREINYKQIAESPSFQTFLKQKRAFIVPVTIFFFVFYFFLPVLTSYFTFLNKPAIGAVSWAWLFAMAQFVMTWTLSTLYSRKAAQFDRFASALQLELKGEKS
ncbi:DUF485 domain-containing protein [Bacillus atrophaeus]|uniref:DUF485 domain-containing protein n=1 Tax=Bacillus atrophaeus TaxID=1452 RepID=UPI002E24FC5D|nr:DUF485 domain-containing protein [Bacillus atrophaeus]MED4811104.1 DUF485 domain-containing protein [Bacillus atrophaeus]MED4858601.1 DUF485 domain-containing protein [Bacillus atrophaeus]